MTSSPPRFFSGLWGKGNLSVSASATAPDELGLLRHDALLHVRRDPARPVRLGEPVAGRQRQITASAGIQVNSNSSTAVNANNAGTTSSPLNIVGRLHDQQRRLPDRHDHDGRLLRRQSRCRRSPRRRTRARRPTERLYMKLPGLWLVHHAAGPVHRRAYRWATAARSRCSRGSTTSRAGQLHRRQRGHADRERRHDLHGTAASSDQLPGRHHDHAQRTQFLVERGDPGRGLHAEPELDGVAVVRQRDERQPDRDLLRRRGAAHLRRREPLQFRLAGGRRLDEPVE